MADENIYITITDAPITSLMGGVSAGNGGSQNIGGGEENANSSLTSSTSGFVTHQFFNFVQNQAKQIANYSINNIGNFTGNYQTQRQVSEMLSIAGKFKNIGLATLGGFKVGGPVGAVAAGIISVASMAIGDFMQYNSTLVQTQQQNREISILRNISGLDTLNNGSRWGS